MRQCYGVLNFSYRFNHRFERQCLDVVVDLVNASSEEYYYVCLFFAQLEWS